MPLLFAICFVIVYHARTAVHRLHPGHDRILRGCLPRDWWRFDGWGIGTVLRETGQTFSHEKAKNSQ